MKTPSMTMPLCVAVPLCALMLLTSCISTTAKDPKPVLAPLDPASYVVTVTATCQDYSFGIPWRKFRPYSKNGQGVLINGKHVLVPADILRNHTFIELETMDKEKKTTAELVHIDYTANLALVKPEDAEFMEGMASLDVVEKLMIDDQVEAWQFESNGEPVVTQGTMFRAQAGFGLLNYRCNIDLPAYLTVTKGMPVVSGRKLAGVSTSYSSSSKSLYAIPAQIINHFLRDMKEGEYQGFPGAGFGYTLLDDPELRKFIALPEGENGVYITYVRPNSPAAAAGIQKGDVLLGIDQFDLDRSAKYKDPDYGDVHFHHLINTKSFSGTVRTFHLWRDQKRVEAKVTLKYLPNSTYPVPPYIYDRGPDYIVVGGFVLQELSRQYLRAWKDWQDNAPPRLVYYDRNQWELAKPGYKPVVLGLILPAPGNRGHEEFSFKRIKTVNGNAVMNLRDVQTALKSPVKQNDKEFHHFTFFYRPHEVVLDVEQAKQDDEFLKERFQIPTLQKFHDSESKEQ